MVKSVIFYVYIFIGLAAVFIGIRELYISRKLMKKGIRKKGEALDITAMKMIHFPVYCLVLLSGLALLFFLASKECYVLGKLIKTGIKTEAVLVDIVRSSGNNSSRYPIFEYTDQSGTLNRFRNNSSLTSDKYKVGDVVDILYHPDTKVARIDSFYGLYFGLVFILFVGSVFTFVGGAGVLGILKNNSEPTN